MFAQAGRTATAATRRVGARRVGLEPRVDGVAEPRLTEGERWTRGELEALLARRFSPRAIVRFLRHSSVRSAEIRRERPALAHRAQGWIALGAAAYLPLVGRRRAALAWWALVALMLDWHLGMVETEHGEPRNLSAADALTLGRAWLVPLALDAPTPLVCATAAATDVLDGRIARRVGTTRAGRDLEGLVDTSFAAAALRGARRRHWLGRRVVAAELARLGAGFAYALLVYFGRARAPADDLLHAARATTALRMAGLAVAGAGRRRDADALMLTGSAASVALLVRSARAR